MNERFESQLRNALERRAGDVPDEAYERLREIDYRPKSPAAGLALGVTGLAARFTAP